MPPLDYSYSFYSFSFITNRHSFPFTAALIHITATRLIQASPFIRTLLKPEIFFMASVSTYQTSFSHLSRYINPHHRNPSYPTNPFHPNPPRYPNPSSYRPPFVLSDRPPPFGRCHTKDPLVTGVRGQAGRLGCIWCAERTGLAGERRGGAVRAWSQAVLYYIHICIGFIWLFMD